jgi:hypothetical protein
MLYILYFYLMRIILPIFCLILVSCSKDKVPDILENIVHVSHSRLTDNSEINAKATSIDYSKFDLTILGGDMAYLSSYDIQTMSFLDNIFDLSANTTLWTLGNHDYSDTSLVRDYTDRNNFYSYHQNGITYLVLDTQMDTCNIVNAQLELVQSVTDTISASSHLMVLTHKLIWMVNHPTLHDQIPFISNGHYEPYSYSLHDNNFYQDIYPKLIDVRNRGIEVICLAGDLGLFANEFEFTTQDDIHYIASGLNDASTSDRYLILEHNITQRTLSWHYKK